MKVGDKVFWIAAGKVSRLDGVRSKRVSGIVQGFRGSYVIVKKDYPSLTKLAMVPYNEVVSKSIA